MGGFFGEKKNEIMQMVPIGYKPKEILVLINDQDAIDQLNKFTLPVFLKPNVGERGYEVVEIHSKEEFKSYQQKGFDFIIQEKLNQNLEFGLSYHCLEGVPKVSSLVLKEFMQVVGDGHSTVLDLISKHPRHRLFIELLKLEHPKQLAKVPEKGEISVIHRIGNHSKGTRFINMDHHINEQLTSSIHELAQQIIGLDYGRFDFKVSSLEALEQGDIKIFELNGVSAEPGSMYDQAHIGKAIAYCCIGIGTI